MNAATNWINWLALGGLVGLFFTVLIVVATVWLAAKFKNVTFHEIIMTYSKLVVLGSIATLAVVGGGVFFTGLMNSVSGGVQEVVPGVSGPQQPGQEPTGEAGG